MIAQAEGAFKDAREKGLEANQALKERQETLDKLKKEAAQNRKEIKEAMAKVRTEGPCCFSTGCTLSKATSGP